MAALPPALDKLATLLSRLPGVGQRTASRYALFVLNEPEGYGQQLGQALAEVREHVHFCDACHTLTEDPQCKTCGDPSRDQGLLCVVERFQDVVAIEATGSYRGLYHVMHGVLAPLRGIGPEQLRLANLELRLQDTGVHEVIIATNSDVEGEATAMYLARRLSRLDVSVSRLATGMPLGGELEYVDQRTLGRALEGRIPLGI